MELSDQDLEDALFGVRALAHTRRGDLAQQAGSSTAAIFERQIARLDALAMRFEAEIERRRVP